MFDKSLFENDKKQPISNGQFDTSVFDVRPIEVQQAEGNYNSVAQLEIDPDTEAQDVDISQKTGFPLAAVKQNREQSKRIADKPDFDHLMRISPGTGRFYGKPDNMAVASDDAENLSMVEIAANKLMGTFDSILKTPIRTIPVMAESVDRVVSVAGGLVETVGKGLVANSSDLFKQTGLDQIVFGSLQKSGTWLKEWGKDSADWIREEILNDPSLSLPEELRGRLIDNPQYIVDPEWLAFNTGEAANSMISVIAAYAAGGPAAATITGGLVEAGPAYTEMIDDPNITDESALVAAGAYGFVSGLLNKIGLDRIMAKVPVGSLMSSVARRLTTGTVEATTEYLEEPVEAAAKSMAAGDDFDTIMSKVIDSFKNIDVIPGSFLLGAAGAVTQDSKSKEAESAEYMEHQMALAEAVTNSKLKERSPDKMVEALVEMGVSQPVYMAADDAISLFQSKNDETEAFMKKTGLSIDDIQEAIAEGRDIQINTADIHAYTSDEFQQDILRRTKADTGSLSADEIAAVDQGIVNSQLQAIEQESEAVDVEIERIREEGLNARLSPENAEASVAIFKAMANNLVKQGSEQIDFLKRVKVFYKPIRSLRVEPFELHARGRVQVTNDYQYVVSLFADQNESTIVHEFAHIYMREVDRLREEGLLSEEGKKTVGFIDEWLGSTSIKNLSVMEDEIFAASFENYLLYGKAPTKKLQPVFTKYKKWLTDIYKEAFLPVSPDVKKFFDKMLADDMAIETAAAVNGMVTKPSDFLSTLQVTPEDKIILKELLKESKLEASGLMVFDRDAQKKEQRATWTAEATKDVEQKRVYKTIDNIGNGPKWKRLNRETIIQDYGKIIVDQLPKQIVITDGRTPEAAAEENGYIDFDDMITEILESEPKQALIKESVKLEETAHDAKFKAEEYISFTTQYSDYLEIVDKYVTRSSGNEQRLKPAKAYTEHAKQKISEMTMKDAMSYRRYLSAMKKANQNLLKSVKAKDWRKASLDSEQARLNYEYAKESVRLRGLADKFNKKITRINKTKKSSIHPDFLDNIKVLGFRYGILSSLNLADAQNVKPLNDLTISDDIMGDGVEFEDWLYNTTDNRSVAELSVHEFSELRAAVDYLEHVGRKLNKKGEQTLSFAPGLTINQAIEQTTASMAPLKSKNIIREDNRLKKFAQASRLYSAGNKMFIFLMRGADGFTFLGNKEKGPNERIILDTLSQQNSEKLRRTAEDQVWIKEFIDHFKKRIGNTKFPKSLDIDVQVPENMRQAGRSWTFERVLSLALHMGTEHNRQAVMGGYGLSETDLSRLMEQISDADWQQIQKLWNSLNAKWPDLSAVYKRKYGIAPQKVESVEFVTPSNLILQGGYFPLRFDSLLDSKVQERDELEVMKNASVAAFGPAPFSGMMKKRKKTSGGKPPRLDLSIISQHVEYVNSYVTYAESISEIDKIIQSEEYRTEFTRVFGSEFYGQRSIDGRTTPKNAMRNTLKDIVGSKVSEIDDMNGLLRWLKSNTVRFALGVNPSVSLKQAFSLPGFIKDQGIKTYKAGVIKVSQNPKQAYLDMLEVSPSMKERAGGFDRDIVDIIVNRTSKIAKGIDTLNFALIKAVDAATVTPMWWGVFMNEMDTTDGNVSAASARADNAVSFSQPFNRAIDKAAIQRESGWISFFNMFSSFTLKFGNRQWAYTQAKRNGVVSTRQYVNHIALERILPPVMMSLMFGMLWGDPPDDDETLFEMIGDVAKYQVAGLPLVRDFASILEGAISGGRSQGLKSPLSIFPDMIENTIRNLTGLAQNFDNPKTKEKAAWSVFELVSFSTGIPASQIFKKWKKANKNIEKGNGTIGDYMLVPSYK